MSSEVSEHSLNHQKTKSFYCYKFLFNSQAYWVPIKLGNDADFNLIILISAASYLPLCGEFMSSEVSVNSLNHQNKIILLL
jgi:hypothetical protein